MSIITKVYNKIVLISPKIEVAFRQFYWKNYTIFKKYRPKSNVVTKDSQKINFENILSYLRESGIKEGSILIVHSSYASLEKTGLSPNEIIDKLKKLVGDTGTLCMPIIRKYKGEPKIKNILTTNMDDTECVYDIQKSRVTSGVLPFFLKKRKDCVISRFPLNPMGAIGPLARDMMNHNLDGERPSPHGVNSSWKYCYDNDAIVLGLGIDLSHYLTIMHTAEEAFPNWPIKDWYRERKFRIKDNDFETKKIILERKPKWGMLYLAERRFANDLLINKILIRKEVDGVRVDLVDSRILIEFLNERKKSSYPYVISKKNNK